MVSQIIRLERLYNRRGRDGLLGVGRTKLFSDLLFRDDGDPYIPGTTVRRMQTIRLGPKAVVLLCHRPSTFAELARSIRGVGHELCRLPTTNSSKNSGYRSLAGPLARSTFQLTSFRFKSLSRLQT